MLKKIAASILLLVLCLQNASSQDNIIRPASFGISYIRNDFAGARNIRSSSLSTVLRNKQLLQASNMNSGLALHYFKGVSPNIDFAFTLSGSSTREALPDRSFTEKKLLLEADAAANFKMLPDNYRFSPYLIAGIGASKYRSYYGAYIPLGGGLKYNFKSATSIFVTLQYRVPVTDEHSAYHFYSSIGISGLFAKKKVQAPPPPTPPADTDGDGIVDSADACPTVVGLAKYNGCPIPDTDKDGINDELDKCPQVAGVAKYDGCPIPDTDKDGVNDEEDRCVNVAGVLRYQGCPVPDTDNDGVND
jgi:OOP family OmpA-OmpF porin